MPDRVSTASKPEERRVLLLPTTKRDAEAISKLLTNASISCVICDSIRSLCDYMAEGCAAIIISEESILPDHRQLEAELHKQPVWSDLPIILLSRAGAELPRLTTALPHLGNVSVLERPVRMNTLLSIVRSALRARERQYQVRAYVLQRDKAEQLLRSGEERLRLALETGKLGVWELELPSKELSSTEGCKAAFGLGAEDPFTYDDFVRALHPDDKSYVENAVEASIKVGTEYDAEYRTIWPDQSIHWILARGRPSYHRDGSPIKMVGVTLDITDRKTIEERRRSLLEAERAARSEAERAGRMKDEFLATLSHELRTPLNAILGWAQMLKRHPEKQENFIAGIDIIERNARAQTQIIDDLLDMSKIISGKISLNVQAIELTGVVKAAIETVQTAADAKGVKLISVLDTRSEPISGDPNRLQQVFWNLLTNAIKFTPKGGTVQVVLQHSASSVEVNVTDSGAGIQPAFLPYVFDRFRQADSTTTRNHGGLGIGLAIVKQLSELHGGTVSATSEGANQGSTFTVTLPLRAMISAEEKQPTKVEAAAPHECEASNEMVSLQGMKVLVVDDEKDSRSLIQRLLEECSATVITAASAEEGFLLLKAERPDVLVSDVGMPGEDGYDFVRRIRKLGPAGGGDTPAIALTAYARTDDRVSAIKAGFQHHLRKPVEANELIAVLVSLGGRGEGRTPT